MRELKLLAIDDDEASVLLLKYMLAETNRTHFDISWCAGGEEALPMLKQGLWDVCILDHRLGGAHTGIDVLREARDAGITIPIIMLTGMSDGHTDLQALQAGANDFLPKDAITSALLERSILYTVERARHERSLRELATIDAVTGVANRALFQSTLYKTLDLAKRNQTKASLLFIDLDRFKPINDTLGHDIGDLVLRKVSQLLQYTARSSDLVARLGGDEFALILNEVENGLSACRVANDLVGALTEPLDVSGYQLSVTPSIGIATFPEDAEDSDTLTRAADTAMYAAKKNGGSQYCFFSREMQSSALLRAQIETDLAVALKSNQLTLQYQPEWTISEYRVRAVEALLRWSHPKLGNISPATFIPIAERTPMIHDIGDLVMRLACQEYEKHMSKHFYRGTRLSINVSMQQLQQEKFLTRIVEILQDTNFKPENLEIEVTESALMADPSTAIPTLNELRNLGVSIAIDDFGTGHSSLGHLAELPVDILKIDRSFVQKCRSSDKHYAIVKAIISLAYSLDLQTVAEGVEDQITLEMLHDLKCNYIQGFHLARPQNPAHLVTYCLSKREAISNAVCSRQAM